MNLKDYLCCKLKKYRLLTTTLAYHSIDVLLKAVAYQNGIVNYSCYYNWRLYDCNNLNIFFMGNFLIFEAIYARRTSYLKKENNYVCRTVYNTAEQPTTSKILMYFKFCYYTLKISRNEETSRYGFKTETQKIFDLIRKIFMTINIGIYM